MEKKPSLATPLTLPCGAVVPNRLVKAAMTEGLATMGGVPTSELDRLYGKWSDGGAGVLISGNIQVDRNHLEQPGNVVIDGKPNPELKKALATWACSAKRGGNQFWAQISHAGRQTPKNVNPNPKAPSAVPLDIPGGQFGEPVALTAPEIEDIVRRFGVCAAAVKAAGFRPPTRNWNRQLVVEAIRDRHREGLPLTDVRHHDSGLCRAALLHFGSWRAAMAAADSSLTVSATATTPAGRSPAYTAMAVLPCRW